MLRLILILVPIAVTIYALIDAIAAPRSEVRTLPKFVWIIVIILLWIGGAVLWFFLGRPRAGGNGPGPGGGEPPQRRPQGPDDDPDFIADLNRRNPKPRPETGPSAEA